MPLTFMNIGSSASIIKITGHDESRLFLNNLGFVEGEELCVISKNGGNMILGIKNSRVVLDFKMAQRIMVR